MQGPRLLEDVKKWTRKMDRMEPPTHHLHGSSTNKHISINRGANEKESPSQNKLGHPKMGIQAKRYLHTARSLPLTCRAKLQQCKINMEKNMAFKSLAKNYLLSLADAAPQHPYLGQLAQTWFWRSEQLLPLWPTRGDNAPPSYHLPLLCPPLERSNQ